MSISIDNKYVRLISFKLRNFKQKNTNLYNASCPFCGDSKKNLTKARLYIFEKKGGLFVKCHNCGIGTNVANLLKHIDENLFKEYSLERYTSGKTNNSKLANTILNITPTRFDKLEKAKTFEHAEWCDKLPEGHFCLEYLKHRKIDKSHYERLLFTQNYRQFVDALIPNHGKQLLDDARLVIPFYDEYNELIAVSGRALVTSDKTLRYVTIRTKESNDKLIFGMDRVNRSKDVYIVEGPLDSLFIDNCVASGDANLILAAKSISVGKKILIFDNEPRNKEVMKLMQNAIKLDHFVVIWPDNLIGKDINEMIMNGKTKTEIQSIISSNSFKGLEAQAKFTFWKKV